MSVFEFYTVLLSFVVSLGVASLLNTASRLIQDAGRVKFSWPYLLWMIVVFNLMITFWIKSWSYHDIFELRLTHAAPPLLLAIVGYLACGLATLPIPEQGIINLESFHERQGPKYMIAVAAFMVLAIIQALLMGRQTADGVAGTIGDNAVEAFFGLFALVSARFIRVRWLQVLTPLVFLVSSVFYYTNLIGW